MINIIYSLKTPELYVCKITIREYKPFKGKNIIEKEKASNTVIGLMDIRDIPEDPFVTLKIDGLTTMVAYLKEYGIFCYDLKGKLLFKDTEVHKREDKILDVNRVFLAEYHNGCFYLFMEANDLYRDFNIDYHNMTDFVNKYNDDSKIRVNYIVLSKKGERHQRIIQKLLAMKASLPAVNGKVPETDGIIIGSIKTKFQYKWKPQDQLTIDFYLRFAKKVMHMYVGDRLFNAKRTIKKKWYKKRVSKGILKYILGKGQYINLLFLAYKPDLYEEWKKLYSRKIVECKRYKGKWIPIRIREDKEVPNNIRTAKNNIHILNNPIKFSDLMI